jgi:hypothetical protein
VLFVFDFKSLKKHTPHLFLSPILIAIIDIFQWYQKNILGNNDFGQ